MLPKWAQLHMLEFKYWCKLMEGHVLKPGCPAGCEEQVSCRMKDGQPLVRTVADDCMHLWLAGHGTVPAGTRIEPWLYAKNEQHQAARIASYTRSNSMVKVPGPQGSQAAEGT